MRAPTGYGNRNLQVSKVMAVESTHHPAHKNSLFPNFSDYFECIEQYSSVRLYFEQYGRETIFARLNTLSVW